MVSVSDTLLIKNKKITKCVGCSWICPRLLTQLIMKYYSTNSKIAVLGCSLVLVQTLLISSQAVYMYWGWQHFHPLTITCTIPQGSPLLLLIFVILRFVIMPKICLVNSVCRWQHSLSRLKGEIWTSCFQQSAQTWLSWDGLKLITRSSTLTKTSMYRFHTQIDSVSLERKACFFCVFTLTNILMALACWSCPHTHGSLHLHT